MGSNRIPRGRYQDIAPVAAGTGIIFGARELTQVTFIAGAGCTLTYSRVDSPTANAHVAPTATVSAGTKTTIPADWPWYYVDAAGGSGRVGGV